MNPRGTRITVVNERKLLQQMSSGCGTQQNDSKDEPTYAESLELQVYNYATQPNDGDPESFVLLPSSLKPAILTAQHSAATATPSPPPLPRHHPRSIGVSERKTSTPTICGSVENIAPKLNEHKSHGAATAAAAATCSYASPTTSHGSKSEQQKFSVSGSIHTHTEYNIPRMMSDQSLNSLSNDHDDVFPQQNLRDELLNCDKKELFQFLNDDFDNSHNYFSDTVGFGSAVIDPDTDSLMFENNQMSSRRDTSHPFSPARKTSTASNKSNLSYISNSIFETLEQTRGGSISESIDRKSLRQIKAAATVADTYPHCDELEPLVQDSEFENIIASFEKELSSIKNSTCSLQRQLSAMSRTPDPQAKGSFEKSSSTNTYEEILPVRLNSINNNTTATNSNSIISRNNESSTRESVKLKRRSLEKQMKIDDDFNVSHEIKRICDNMQAPYAADAPNYHHNEHQLQHRQRHDHRGIELKQSSSYSGTGSSGKINSILISPKTRRRSEFHSSLDRIKRNSYIERVDESLLETEPMNASQAHDQHQQQQILYQPNSERLPRKYLNADMNIESLSLKSTGSYEHLVCHTESKEQKKIRFQKSCEENDSSVNEKDKGEKHTGDDGDEAKGKWKCIEEN